MVGEVELPMANKTKFNLGIRIPPIPELDPENGRRVNDAIAQVLKRLQEKGLIPGGATYTDLEKNPGHLMAFIKRFKENRDQATDLVVDKDGKPVEDDTTTLVCGLTLAQVERAVVLKCATTLFAEAKTVPGGGIPESIKEYLAFAWQLPLLSIYSRENVSVYFRELGDAMLLLRSPAALEALVTTSLGDVRSAQEAVGDRFIEMMKTAPQAIKVVARCSTKQFAFLARLTGKRVWKFFGDNQQLAVELLAVDAKRVLALGPHFPDLCVETLQVLDEVPTTTLAPFMKSFDSVFGNPGRALLGDERFAKEFLRTVVGDFRGMEAKNEEELETLSNAAALKWNAIKPRLIEWVKARQAHPV